MTKKILLTLFAIVTLKVVIGQNYIYKGDKQFSATQTWSFKLTNYQWHSEGLEMTIGKNNSGGFLMLSIEVPFDETISGTIFMILQNGKTVNLISKVVSDHVDSKTQVLYTVSPTQIEQLKESNISKVRFNLKNVKKGLIGGLTGNFTANNKVSEYIYNDDPNTWNTTEDIINLFETED